MSEYVLRTFDLGKSYGSQRVLDKVCMNVERGAIYGFVGENGSGKTTVIRAICGLIKSEGSYELFGVPSTSPEILNERKKMGAIVEAPSIYPGMSARENMEMQAIILGINEPQRIRTALNLVGLGALYDDKKKAGNFSLGMRQRLGIAMAILSDAQFMVLDEPLNGLDPEGIVGIRNLIMKLNQEYGVTFLISSHILTELSLVATKYGIISKGHIIREITQEELQKNCRKTILIQTSDKALCHEALLKAVSEADLKEVPYGYVISGDYDYSKIIEALAGVPVTGINTSSTTIEDYYLSIIRGGNANE